MFFSSLPDLHARRWSSCSFSRALKSPERAAACWARCSPVVQTKNNSTRLKLAHRQVQVIRCRQEYASDHESKLRTSLDRFYALEKLILALSHCVNFLLVLVNVPHDIHNIWMSFAGL